MSYARFGWDDSDVYVFPTDIRGQEVLTCCGCFLSDHDFYGDATAMIDHLNLHRENNMDVPEDTFTDIMRDYFSELDIEDIIMNKVVRGLDNFVTTYDKPRGLSFPDGPNGGTLTYDANDGVWKSVQVYRYESK